ncbi:MULTISPECIES: hypothetical protein [unclassified Pseudoalteromonas]|uniref:hypothetical protein n=1 Tax=unclassified Pseudoalteromonas TaxID=194690 RepID=UPI000CF693B4|nr:MULTISPECIES: hypothetical protein [unclassified Pseudoalteromonas]
MRRVVLVVALILCVTLVSAKQPSESHSATNQPAAVQSASPSFNQLASPQQTMPHNLQLDPKQIGEHVFELADDGLSGQLNLSN